MAAKKAPAKKAARKSAADEKVAALEAENARLLGILRSNHNVHFLERYGLGLED